MIISTKEAFNSKQPKVAMVSGGKDSVAMILKLYEKKLIPDVMRNVHITGWEYPEIIESLEILRDYTKIKLEIHKAVDDMWKLFKKHGAPSYNNRWCTSIKEKYLNKNLKKDTIKIIGIAQNEGKRIITQKKVKHIACLPLVDYGTKEANTINIIKKHLPKIPILKIYKIMTRVGCYLCPMKRNSELYRLYKHYPKLWNKMLKKIGNEPFKSFMTLNQWNDHFKKLKKSDINKIDFLQNYRRSI